MRFRPLTDHVAEAEAWASQAHPRIATGFPFFDARTDGGMTYGELLVFLARTSVGKTWWLLNVFAANKNTPTVFFSLEMHGRFVAVRLAAVATDTNTGDIQRNLRSGEGSPALAGLPDLFPKFTICDEPGLNLRQMSDVLHQAEDAWGERVRLVGIDYLELVGGVPGMERAAQVSDLARNLKNWARAHDVALVVLHQVPRGRDGNNGHLPLTLGSGRYGGEEAADYVLAGYRPHLDPELEQSQRELARREFYLQFLKTRGGSETHEDGVLHTMNPGSGRIRPLLPSQVYEARQLGLPPEVPESW